MCYNIPIIWSAAKEQHKAKAMVIIMRIPRSAAVIAIQVSKQFLMSGAEAYVGGSIAVVMIREIAPGFVALAIGARAGTAISAEIANMQVTSQVDAIKTLKVDPVGYYFAPRILAAAPQESMHPSQSKPAESAV